MKHGVVQHLIVLSAGLVVVAGCAESGGTKVKTVDVSGTVYLDGEPVEGVTVNFEKTENHAGTGTTGPDGKYKLAGGAEPGENKVYFSKVEGSGFDPSTGMDPGQMAAAAGAPPEGQGPAGQPSGELLPQKYMDPATSGVTLPVPENGTDSADFKLTSQ
ncbi:MAG: hypothetical protein ABIP48_22940 [Planctomycetota bacterium]